MALVRGKPWKEYQYKHEDPNPVISDWNGQALIDCTKKGLVLHIKEKGGAVKRVRVNARTLDGLRSVICRYYGWSRWHDEAVEKIARAEAEKQVREEMGDEIKRRTRELKNLIESGIDAKLAGVKLPRRTNRKAEGQRELVL
jgi:hypothetical protein